MVQVEMRNNPLAVARLQWLRHTPHAGHMRILWGGFPTILSLHFCEPVGVYMRFHVSLVDGEFGILAKLQLRKIGKRNANARDDLRGGFTKIELGVPNGLGQPNFTEASANGTFAAYFL